jgi:hypothetical protein
MSPAASNSAAGILHSSTTFQATWIRVKPSSLSRTISWAARFFPLGCKTKATTAGTMPRSR